MIDKEELCKQIRLVYPDTGECRIDVAVDYDGQQQRWVVDLKKENKELRTFLEPGDAENCMMGKQCLRLAIEINQLKESIERMPETFSNGEPVSETETETSSAPPVCEKAPDLAEHYRMEDDDLPCDDGRSGRI